MICLRSVFMTYAANNGAAFEKIVEVSRHKDLRVAMGMSLKQISLIDMLAKACCKVELYV